MKKKLKIENIKIIYVTPKKQLWGILANGIKLRIFSKINSAACLNNCVESTKLITYKDSKLFKKGIKFTFISEGIKLFIKNKKYVVKTVNKEFLENQKNKCYKIEGNKENRYLELNKNVLKLNYLDSNSEVFSNRSPLRYPGGKTRACKTLHKILITHFDPEHFDCVISPFFGGGSFEFFLSNKYKYKICANDKYDHLANFWNVCKTNKEKLMNLLDNKPANIDKETFSCYKKKLKSTDNKILQAYYFFVLNRCSFNGTVGSGGFSKLAATNRFTQSSIDSISNLNLLKLVISNYDFEVFLENNCDGNSLIFLDPPYFSNKNSKLYGDSGDLHTNFDHLRLFEYISKKNNWIMTYDNSRFIKDLYADFKQIEVGWSYGMSRSKKELVIIGK